ncbi:glycosyltransferase family 4 protein [Microbacterium memoriense]|uniref:Glycosyltransferase family 4 protein n=1 Tax=Microbacterium memoriense TaxID=2978350 RepID=A0ABT2PCJ4_9MICO|nr:glycosyltransferase family 1 protein [Microbacterium memoriense]MCT9001927.1 glycosyltransferase family 4 protein [Microbacterium memoriense]
MRVLFDGFWWVKGPTANQTVMREFVKAWVRAFPRDEVLVAVRSRHRDDAILPATAAPVYTHLAPQAATNALELGVLAKKHHVDAVVAHNYAPLFGRSAVFIHDLLFKDHPEWFTTKERVYFAAMGPLARRADAVCTSSLTEAYRIERLEPRLRPVSATGLGVSSQLAAATARRPASLRDVRRFVLSVGRMNVRKNLGVAIEGAMLAHSVSSERPLVIVGSSEYSGAAADLPPTVKDYVADGRLVFLGRISDEELRWMYEQADGFIFVSRDEGFGLPPIEARHFGAPVIVSDIAVMREVAGPEAVFVSPNSPREVARAIDLLPARRGVHRPVGGIEHEWERCVAVIRARLDGDVGEEAKLND